MAASIGISVQAFVKWGVEPHAKIGRHTFYRVDDVLRNRLAHQAAKLQKDQSPVTDAELMRARDQAELELTRERAEFQRLKNAELRRELAPVEMLTWALSDLASQIVPIINTIPNEIRRRNTKITNTELYTMREVIANALNLCAEVRIDFRQYDDQAEQPDTQEKPA